ncbi:MAG: tetratricopeptide repeat protein [Pseudomonadales bacterium]
MSDYLTDEEQLAKLKGWWESNGMALIGAVVVAVAGVVGWRWYSDSTAEQIARASDLYADFLVAEGAEQQSILDTMARELPDSTYLSFAILAEAHDRVIAEDYPAAEAALRRALATNPERVVADLIRVRLGRVLQQLDRSDEALEVLGAVRSAGFRPQVAELKGDIHLARGEKRLAHEAYKAALADLPDGSQKPLLELKAADTAEADDA